MDGVVPVGVGKDAQHVAFIGAPADLVPHLVDLPQQPPVGFRGVAVAAALIGRGIGPGGLIEQLFPGVGLLDRRAEKGDLRKVSGFEVRELHQPADGVVKVDLVMLPLLAQGEKADHEAPLVGGVAGLVEVGQLLPLLEAHSVVVGDGQRVFHLADLPRYFLADGRKTLQLGVDPPEMLAQQVQAALRALLAQVVAQLPERHPHVAEREHRIQLVHLRDGVIAVSLFIPPGGGKQADPVVIKHRLLGDAQHVAKLPGGQVHLVLHLHPALPKIFYWPLDYIVAIYLIIIFRMNLYKNLTRCFWRAGRES